MPQNRPQGSYHQNIQPFLEEGEQSPLFSQQEKEGGGGEVGEATRPFGFSPDSKTTTKNELKRNKTADLPYNCPIKIMGYLERRLDAGLAEIDQAGTAANSPEDLMAKANLEALWIDLFHHYKFYYY